MRKVIVLGADGMVGSAMLRVLDASKTFDEVKGIGRSMVDLTCQVETHEVIARERPEWIVLCAAKVGGIHANNKCPKDFIYDNLMIAANVIEGAFRAGISGLLFLGSSCIYPKYTTQPILEEQLLTGSLEPTNESYAVAKIAGIKLCEAYNRQNDCDFRSVMPTNLYGLGDNYHPLNSHVIPGLLRRFHEAKISEKNEVVVWGDGSAKRDFLYADDLALACLKIMTITPNEYRSLVDPQCSHINVGSGADISIADLAQLVSRVVGYEGEILFDSDAPVGTPVKKLNIEKISSLGWAPATCLESGLEWAYGDFCQRMHFV